MKVGKITVKCCSIHILNSYPTVNFQHSERQAYIAFSQTIGAAAFEEFDSTPIEGFDPEVLDEILGLREKGLRSCVILPPGYRDEKNDWLVNLPKVRKSREELVTLLN